MREDPRGEAQPEVAEAVLGGGVVEGATAVAVGEAEVDVRAVARRVGPRERGEARAYARAARDLAHDLLHDNAAIGRVDSLCGHDGDLALVLGELGHEALGLRADAGEGAHHFRGERLREPLRLKRERQRGRARRHELKLVLEARVKHRAELGLELLERAAQEGPRAALPR